jgi:Na+-transporting NADH:ubiquinone oxidoreductase subunit NqrB
MLAGMVRVWAWSRRAYGIVAIVAGTLLIVVHGLPYWEILIGVVVWLVLFVFLFDPRRSWWGDGPAQLVDDPVRWRRHRMMDLLVIGGAILIAVVLPLAGFFMRGGVR